MEIFGFFFWTCSRRLKNKLKIDVLCSNVKTPIFEHFTKKTRAEISRNLIQFSSRDLSYEAHSGPKTKTEKSAPLGRGVRGAEPLDKII